MNKFTYPALKLLAISALAVLLSACGGGGGGGGTAGATATTGSGLVLNITDAPVNDADISEVWVRFTQVIVHPADDSGDIIYNVEDTSDPNDIKPYREIELKALVGGKTALLGEIPLDAGDYSWIRLVIDPDHTHIVETSGGDYLVKCPSCVESGFKLNREFTIDATGWIDFTIDFDLRKSITLTQPNKPREDFHYILRPTLRILDTELASSFIHGAVIDQHSEIEPDACWVYVYEGDAASITPDDICLDPDTSICPSSDRPLLETPVLFDNASGDYLYNTGFMYPGTYTVALVCEADDPDIDENLLFMSESEVLAEAVPEGAAQDLTLVEVPILTLLMTMENTDEDGSGTVTVDDTLTYLMSIGNEGNVTLDNVTLTNTLAGLTVPDCGATTLPDSLATAATIDCTATYTVLVTDTTVANTATANSDQAGPVESTISVDVVVPQP